MFFSKTNHLISTYFISQILEVEDTKLRRDHLNIVATIFFFFFFFQKIFIFWKCFRHFPPIYAYLRIFQMKIWLRAKEGASFDENCLFCSSYSILAVLIINMSLGKILLKTRKDKNFQWSKEFEYHCSSVKYHDKLAEEQSSTHTKYFFD